MYTESLENLYAKARGLLKGPRSKLWLERLLYLIEFAYRSGRRDGFDEALEKMKEPKKEAPSKRRVKNKML